VTCCALQGLRTLDSEKEDNASADGDEFNINDYTVYRNDDRETVSYDEDKGLPVNSGDDFVPSLLITPAQLSLLWDPVLRNRSQNGDLDGCLEILSTLRKSSVDCTVQQWERVFSSAVTAANQRNKSSSSSRYLSPTPSVIDIVKLLETMTESDKIKPSGLIIFTVLTHFADLDEPKKVYEVIKIIKKCGIAIDSSISDIIQHMKRFDLVLDMLEN
jgi:hypothetical protein